MEIDTQADSSSTDTKGNEEKPTRKKFAVPPVKVACLECRASRTRCDGGKPECSNCKYRNKPCVYTQSKRGGARVRKRPSERNPPANNNELNHCPLSIVPYADASFEYGLPSSGFDFSTSFTAPLSLVAPGGGLKQLDLNDPSFVFDSVFASEGDADFETSDLPQHLIRVYSSDEDILNAYYVFIHPYFPVLPPAEAPVVDSPEMGIQTGQDLLFRSAKSSFEPTSPISLAISATLALIPHPDDHNPQETLQMRRAQAQMYAQAAFDTIEVESELLDSVLDPGEALSNEDGLPLRAPFHPSVPIENEIVIALLILSTYEYAQRGNIAKMRNRAGQALTAAMNLGLHAKNDVEEMGYAEGNRRTWWMTYITVCQAGILSNSTPPILLYDSRFTTPSPTIEADPESWSMYLQAQQAISSATQFVIDLDATSKSNLDPTLIWARMIELDNVLEPLLEQADAWALESSSTDTELSEKNVALALRGMAQIKLNSARIKLHRYCAFSDIPVFTKKHCDLHPLKTTTPRDPAPSEASCGCSTFHTPSHYSASPQPDPALLPFSPHASAKICLRSALSIADSFRKLPYPQPGPSLAPAPRTVPVFACCAMQASYAMIMLSYKTKAMGFVGPAIQKDGPASKLLRQLGEGLGLILDALRNYAGAFEAIGGMRDQIELAVRSMDDARSELI